MGIKTYQEKNTKPMEKELAQSDLPVRRKIQKNTQKCHFYEKQYFWVVLGIFLLTGKSDWALVFVIGLVPFSHKFW